MEVMELGSLWDLVGIPVHTHDLNSIPNYILLLVLCPCASFPPQLFPDIKLCVELVVVRQALQSTQQRCSLEESGAMLEQESCSAIWSTPSYSFLKHLLEHPRSGNGRILEQKLAGNRLDFICSAPARALAKYSSQEYCSSSVDAEATSMTKL